MRIERVIDGISISPFGLGGVGGGGGGVGGQKVLALSLTVNNFFNIEANATKVNVFS